MGKIEKNTLLITSLLLLFVFCNALSVHAWDNCPFDIENDPYPGECNRYIDVDKDDICDLSQPAPENRDNLDIPVPLLENETKEEHGEDEYSVEIEGSNLKKMSILDIASLWEISADDLLNKIVNEYSLENNYTIHDSIDDLRQEYKFSPSMIKEIAENVKQKNGLQVIEQPIEIALKIDPEDNPALPVVKQGTLPNYNFPEIFILTLLIYFGGKFFARKSNITIPKERKFWNTLLLLSFIGSAGTGMILVFIRDFDWFTSLDFNFIFWHVEFSIIMTLIGIFHAFWHLKYYLSLFKKNNNFKK